MTDSGQDPPTGAGLKQRRLDHDWYPRPLPANVELGKGAWLYSAFAFLHYHSRRACGLRIGAHSGVYAGSFFELGADSSVTIGDYTTLVGAIIRSDGAVRIGSYCFIAHEVVLADCADARPRRPGSATDSATDSATGLADDDRALPSGSAPPTTIDIGDDVWIGARAVLLGGTRIGQGSIVGAGCVLDRPVPPHSLVTGNPARIRRRRPHAP